MERDLGFRETSDFDDNQQALFELSRFEPPRGNTPIPDAFETCEIRCPNKKSPVSAGTFCEPSLQHLRAAVARTLGGRRLRGTLHHVVDDIRDRQMRLVAGGVVQVVP